MKNVSFGDQEHEYVSEYQYSAAGSGSGSGSGSSRMKNDARFANASPGAAGGYNAMGGDNSLLDMSGVNDSREMDMNDSRQEVMEQPSALNSSNASSANSSVLSHVASIKNFVSRRGRNSMNNQKELSMKERKMRLSQQQRPEEFSIASDEAGKSDELLQEQYGFSAFSRGGNANGGT